MKLKAAAILLLILFSLIPIYLLNKYLQKLIRPRESMGRFFSWMLLVFALIFIYTFLVVLLIRIMFPGS